METSCLHLSKSRITHLRPRCNFGFIVKGFSMAGQILTLARFLTFAFSFRYSAWNSTVQVLRFFDHAATVNARFALKTDDDTFVFIDRLLMELQVGFPLEFGDTFSMLIVYPVPACVSCPCM